MSQDHLFNATLALLADGALIEQTATSPLTFRIVYQGEAVPLSGGLVQRLLNGQYLRESSTHKGENGKKQFYFKPGNRS